MRLFNVHEDRVAKLITDPRGMIGLSDGGAHVDMHDNAGYCTYLLGTWVRDKQIMSLEQAIQRVTAEPATFFGITTEGRWDRQGGQSRHLRLQHRSARKSARSGIKNGGRICPPVVVVWSGQRIEACSIRDLAIFDYNTIGPKINPIRNTEEWQRHLLLAVVGSVWPVDKGVQYTIVNGAVLYEQQRHTGALPGQVLRS